MKKKMLLTSAALLCALVTPTAQAASTAAQATATPPAHFQTAWEQLLEQFGIPKPGSGTNNGNNNGSNNNGSNNNGNNNGSSGNGSTGSTSSAAQAVLSQVNAARAQNGLSALTLDANMNRAANVRAAELAQSFSHTRPNGSRGLTALSEAGVSYRAAGENIAAGQQTAQAVVSAWMNSSGHRANILSAKFSRMGVGQVTISGRTYWVQLFAD